VETPAAVAAMVDCLQAELPPGTLQLVYGNPVEISETLIASPVIRKVSFTGSVGVGRTLARQCAEGFKRTTMELGGHAPVIVWADADLERFVPMLVGHKFRNAGQACLAPTRFLVHLSIEREFSDRFVAAVQALKVGDGMNPAVQMGPMVNARRKAAMAPLVANALEHGADLACGGAMEGLGHFHAPTVLRNVSKFIGSSVGGFLGVFGFMLSFIIVPLYLYYFLIESAKIKQQWSDYLPLRASAFKDELVACLTEINSYLVAFFRGQLFVSVINGLATGAGLMIIGLDFGLLIGLALCIAGIIPYLGIALCWIPAVIIGAVQGGSALIPGDPWWALPLAVTVIFIIVQQIDGLFITPRIVGEAVGLHPMTVIASVLVWALLLGGLLGAILAVPMTASVKVLFQRYIWRARLAPQTVGGAKTVELKPASEGEKSPPKQ
jgi:predicted PurR-regulated permease PerM